jgi:hypothetical protein
MYVYKITMEDLEFYISASTFESAVEKMYKIADIDIPSRKITKIEELGELYNGR